MKLTRNAFFLPIFTFAFISVFSLSIFAQSGRINPSATPTPQAAGEDDTEKVFTEEIKLNILATNAEGNFAPGVRQEDLVINENNVLHQASSVRRVPATVLIVMDTGGEMRQKKSLDLTRKMASAIVGSLEKDDSFALLQYADKAEILIEWTQDREQILDAINKKSNFGRRSAFVDAINLAADFMRKSPLDNKHLVLITDGTDSAGGEREKTAAMRRILATDISVHVVSYTKMEIDDIAPRAGRTSKTPPKPAMPPEIAATLPNGVRDMATAAKVGPTINLDGAMLKKLRERKKDLETSEKALTELAENTNGEIFLPETREEMLEKASNVAQIIDSSYVVTYVPKKALSKSAPGEVRDIEVSSRREGVIVQAKRKLIVEADKK